MTIWEVAMVAFAFGSLFGEMLMAFAIRLGGKA